MTPLAVIGDIHGSAEKLKAMLTALESFAGTLVFTGDYVNGGTASAEVLETLVDLGSSRPDKTTFLCGNHDLALLRYLEDADFGRFCATGGLATLASYLPSVTGDVYAAFRAAFPERYRSFLQRLEACWEDVE